MTTSISILGTGWLGLPLAKTLLQNGYLIKGATTSSDKLATLHADKIDAYQIQLTEAGILGDIDSFLAESQILIINIPPGLRRNPKKDFVATIRHLIPHLESSTVEHVLFISSTSVFEDQEGFPVVTADTLPNSNSNTGQQLIETEQILRSNPNFNTSILRFAGLYDTRRHPATMLSKRKGIRNPLAPSNLIHLDDCLGIIQKIITTKNWNVTFNAASPSHPPKAAYYSGVCTEMGLPIPEYNYDETSKGKIIDSSYLTTTLDYTFKVLLS